MFGRTAGSLTVYIRDTVNGPLVNLWSKSGEIGDFYERAEVALGWDQPFQVKKEDFTRYKYSKVWKYKNDVVIPEKLSSKEVSLSWEWYY